MSTTRLALIVPMILLSMGLVLYPQGYANAAKYCAQLRGTSATRSPNCTFSTLHACHVHVRHRGGGRCYRSH
jgi:hypothetical protein